MFWMMCALASAAEVTVEKGVGGIRAVDAQGQTLTPGAFAEQVGDVDTVDAYNARRNRTRVRSQTLVWGGLGVGLAGGVGAGILSARGQQDAAPGLGLMAVGGASMAIGGVLYGVGTVSGNNLDHYYTLESAQAAIDASADREPLTLVVVPVPKGFEVHYGGTNQSTLVFADRVGDDRTLRKCRTYRILLATAGAAGMGGGMLVLNSIRDADPNLRNELGATSAALGLAGVGALVVGSMINRPDVWYSQDEVDALIAGSGQALGPTTPSAVQVSLGPALLPERGQTPAPGLVLSGTW